MFIDLGNIKYLYRNCKKNAKQRGIDFDIEFDDIIDLYKESKGKCSMTGIEFDNEPPNGKKRPFAASIDRINSDIEYRKDNCRIVCVAINLAMNWYGEGVFDRIAQNYISKNKSSDVKYTHIHNIKTFGRRKNKNGTYTYYPRIRINGEVVSLGSYKSEEDAAAAYMAAKSEKLKQRKFTKDKEDKIMSDIAPILKNQSEKRIQAVIERKKRYKSAPGPYTQGV